MFGTGKSLSEAFIPASTNTQYDDKLFIELQVQNMLCTQIVFCFCFDIQNNLCTQHACTELVVFMYRTRNSMNNLLSYCGLVDARINASKKDLPVPN